MRNILLLSIPLLLLYGCKSCGGESSTPKGYALSQPLQAFAPYDEGYPVTTEDVDPDAPYRTKDYMEYYSDYYKEKVVLPDFDYRMDISKKSFNELRMLRAEILARHNFLFMDYVSRSHFNTKKWYQPVFWYNEFRINLNDDEIRFINRVLELEKELYKQQYVTGADGLKRANIKNLVNLDQFSRIPDEMMKHLKQDGFVINQMNYEQLFHVYDENYYDYTPSFITTDLYLQVLHMHISKEMQTIEMTRLVTMIADLVNEQYQLAAELYSTASSPQLKTAAGWNLVYYAVARSLISGEKASVPDELESPFETEYKHTSEGQGLKSDFLGDSLMDYTQFQPRGMYTRNDTLKKYFRCVKWLNSASIYIDEDQRLVSAIIMGHHLLQSPRSLKAYGSLSEIIGFLAGEENNLSFFHLLEAVKKQKASRLEDLLTTERIRDIRASLYAMDPGHLSGRGANGRTEDFIGRKKVVFTAGRYTFDGEILQRLVHITDPRPLRPFPKALDVFAAMGNSTAENILTGVYQEKKNWAGYADTLKLLQQKFRDFNQWNISVYNKTMETVLGLQQSDPAQPYYMHLPNWQKKNLNTMLAAWTELKHDMVLYIHQPSGAEMGDGGEIPPPQKIAYVEPQVNFWRKCRELLALNKRMLDENDLSTESLESRNGELDDLAGLLERVSVKELAGARISPAEFDSLVWIGGKIEQLTLDIIEVNESDFSLVATPEKYMAVATDVYTYRDQCLQETVGFGDEIYVVAEINGLLYLTRGAVFSHYEFTRSTAGRLTDEDWQKELLENKAPPSAKWMKDIRIRMPKVKTSPNYNLY